MPYIRPQIRKRILRTIRTIRQNVQIPSKPKLLVREPVINNSRYSFVMRKSKNINAREKLLTVKNHLGGPEGVAATGSALDIADIPWFPEFDASML